MIKDFRTKHKYSQSQLAKLIGINKNALAYLERYEYKKDMSKSKNMDKVMRFIRRYEVKVMAHKVYRKNAELITMANKEYNPQCSTITSVLPRRNKSLLTRILEWFNEKL